MLVGHTGTAPRTDQSVDGFGFLTYEQAKDSAEEFEAEPLTLGVGGPCSFAPPAAPFGRSTVPT